ncbi:MAG TPA: porin, partial [Spongiibacteraceae bacterium]
LPALAQAGGTINIGPDQSISVGFGLRSSFTSAENGAPDGKSRSEDFSLDSIRLYVGAQLNKYIKATFNTEKKSDNSVQVIDGIAQFEPMPEFNVWFGRMLPPSDRSNLDGPYYLLAWSYPGLVSQYPSYAVGRDNGVLAWGNIDKKVVYSVGAFEGHNNIGGGSSDSGNLLYAGRLAINFLDAELAPAYYTGSTYFGAADIFTLGLVIQHQTDGVGVATDKGNYTGYNADLLFETKDNGAGSVTLEGAAYKYDTGDTVDANVPISTANGASFYSLGSTDNSSGVGGIKQGKAYLLGAAYLFPQQVGWGKFQPYARYQKFDQDKITVGPAVALYGGKFEQYDIGVNYVIAGPNAKISATYTEFKPNDDDPIADNKKTNQFVIGVQLQF